MTHIANLFASTYGSSTYSCSTYQNGTCTTAATGGTTGGNVTNGILTNTGFDLLLIATLAVSLIFIALLVRFWKRRSKEMPADK